MNIYKLHTNPEQLVHYDEQWKLPENVWNLINVMHYEEHKDTSHLAKYIKYLPLRAVIYARDILNGRFLEAEPYILKSPPAASAYYRWVIGADSNNGGDSDVSWDEADEFYNMPGNKELKQQYHQHITNWMN